MAIERSYGNGKITVLCDSYLFSNEGLWVDPHPGFISYLIGSRESLVFDETHLGIVASPGIAALARRYGFEGFVVGFVFSALIFAWRNHFPLVPFLEHRKLDGKRIIKSSQGQDHSIRQLMKVHVHKKDLVRTCVKQWQNSLSKRRRSVPPLPKDEEFEQAVGSGKNRDLIRAFNTIYKIANKRRRSDDT